MNNAGMEDDNEKVDLPFELASPQHRLGGYAVSSAFSFVTLGIGWIIWSLVVWGQGQTPAHQILKMRVYSIKSRQRASWGRMFLRNALIPFFFSLPLLIYVGLGFWLVSGDRHKTLGIILIIVGYIYELAINLLDSLWIFRKKKRQRLVDLFANTVVVNELAPRTVKEPETDSESSVK